VRLFPKLPIGYMLAHTNQVDPNGPEYQTTIVDGLKVEWGPFPSGRPFLGEKIPRHIVIKAEYPEPK
jgi:hypothetical protein